MAMIFNYVALGGRVNATKRDRDKRKKAPCFAEVQSARLKVRRALAKRKAA